MGNLFRNRYRTKSLRLQNLDYEWDWRYFITICTDNRIHYFGEIENKKNGSIAFGGNCGCIFI